MKQDLSPARALSLLFNHPKQPMKHGTAKLLAEFMHGSLGLLQETTSFAVHVDCRVWRETQSLPLLIPIERQAPKPPHPKSKRIPDPEPHAIFFSNRIRNLCQGSHCHFMFVNAPRAIEMLKLVRINEPLVIKPTLGKSSSIGRKVRAKAGIFFDR